MLVNFKVALALSGERQVDLALRCGVDPTLLSLVINERREPTAELRSKLAEALKVSERWLFAKRTRGSYAGPLRSRRESASIPGEALATAQV
jgi:transcriptional regulator with XRE-family HTH domain